MKTLREKKMLKFKDLMERLNVAKANMGDVIKDFQDSDAPQFKGKSDKKRREMAIAAKLSTEEVEELGEVNYDVDHMPGQTMSASSADKQTKKVHDAWAAGAAARAKGRAEAAKRRLAKEEVEELDEGGMKELSTDMETMDDKEFKAKHRKSKSDMQKSLKSEELKGNQHKIDANKNGKVDGHDFKILRNAKKARYQ